MTSRCCTRIMRAVMWTISCACVSPCRMRPFESDPLYVACARPSADHPRGLMSRTVRHRWCASPVPRMRTCIRRWPPASTRCPVRCMAVRTRRCCVSWRRSAIPAKTVREFVEWAKDSGHRISGLGQSCLQVVRSARGDCPLVIWRRSWSVRIRWICRSAPSVRGSRPSGGIARADRRVFRLPAPVPERRFLHRPDLSGDRLRFGDVHDVVRVGPYPGVDRPVPGDARRSEYQDRPPASGVYRSRATRLCAVRSAVSIGLHLDDTPVNFDSACVFRAETTIFW